MISCGGGRGFRRVGPEPLFQRDFKPDMGTHHPVVFLPRRRPYILQTLEWEIWKEGELEMKNLIK